MTTIRINQEDLKSEISANHAEIKALIESLRDCTCRELDELTRSHPDGEGKDTSVLGKNIMAEDDMEDSIGYGDDGVPPPDGSTNWTEYNQKHCVTAHQIVWMMEQVIEMWISRYEAGILFSLTAATLGIANVFGGVLKFAFRGASSTSGISLAKNSSQFLIPLSVMLTLWDDLKEMLLNVSTANIRSDFQDMKGSLICAIYCGKSPKQIGERFNQAVDESGANTLVKNVAKHLMWPELKNWISKKGEDYEPPEFPEANCTGCDCMGDWHDPDLMVHTHDSLRDMTTSGSDVVSWNNTGAAGGAFVVSSGANPATYSGDAVVFAPGRKMQGPGGRYDAMYVVLEMTTPTDRQRSIMIQDGQDSYKPCILAQTNPRLQLQLKGRDYLYTPIPVGRVVLGMRYDPGDGRTYYTLNGAALGDAAPSGSPGVSAPLILGSITAAYGANCSLWAIVGYSLNNTLTAAQETDIIANLTTLYGPWG
jgi:hypothetical protein